MQLSPSERRALAELERRLAADDPALARRLQEMSARPLGAPGPPPPLMGPGDALGPGLLTRRPRAVGNQAAGAAGPRWGRVLLGLFLVTVVAVLVAAGVLLSGRQAAARRPAGPRATPAGQGPPAAGRSPQRAGLRGPGSQG